MKRFFLTAAALTLVSAALFAQNTFEGSLTMTNGFKENPDAKPDMRMDIKGDKMVMVPLNDKAKDTKIIFDGKENAMYTLVDENGKKIAMKMSMDLIQQMAQQYQPQPTSPGAKPDVKVTGATRTIDGYTCSQVTYTGESATGETWIAKDINLNMKALLPMIKNPNLQADDYGMSGLPLETWGTGKDGKAYSIKFHPEAKTLDASEFEIPSDYTIQDMSEMMKQMQNGQQH